MDAFSCEPLYSDKSERANRQMKKPRKFRSKCFANFHAPKVYESDTPRLEETKLEAIIIKYTL